MIAPVYNPLSHSSIVNLDPQQNTHQKDSYNTHIPPITGSHTSDSFSLTPFIQWTGLHSTAGMVLPSFLQTSSSKTCQKILEMEKRLLDTPDLICIDLHFMDFPVFTFSFSVVVIECVVSTLKLLHKPSLRPPVDLRQRSNATVTHSSCSEPTVSGNAFSQW